MLMGIFGSARVQRLGDGAAADPRETHPFFVGGVVAFGSTLVEER